MKTYNNLKCKMRAHFDTNIKYLAIFFQLIRFLQGRALKFCAVNQLFGHFPAHQPVTLDNFPLPVGIQAVLQEKFLSFKYTHLCKLTLKKNLACVSI